MKQLKLLSLQRQRERYFKIYVWKSIENLAPNPRRAEEGGITVILGTSPQNIRGGEIALLKHICPAYHFTKSSSKISISMTYPSVFLIKLKAKLSKILLWHSTLDKFYLPWPPLQKGFFFFSPTTLVYFIPSIPPKVTLLNKTLHQIGKNMLLLWDNCFNFLIMNIFKHF